MKSKIFAALILSAAMSGTMVVAQDIPATAPTASIQPDTSMGDDFAENRRTCLQQARQTTDPQERQRLIQRCQQDSPSDAKTMSVPEPATPLSAATPQIPDTAGSTGNAPDSMATPMSPDARTDPARTLSPSEMSPEERQELRRLRREQRRLARQQAMQTGAFDGGGSSYDNSFRGGQQRAWPVQGGGYARAESSVVDDDFAAEPTGSSDFGQQSGNERPPRAGNRRGDYVGSANRGQRIRRLEQRMEVIENLLRQVLANQQQLLHR